MNGHYNYSLKHNLIVSFIVCILINGTIVTLLLWQHHEYGHSIWYFKWICNNISTDNPAFQTRYEPNFTLFELYLHIFGPPFCLLVIIWSNHFTFLMHRDNSQEQQERENSLSDQTVDHELKGLNESLINENDINPHEQSSTLSTSSTSSTPSTLQQ